MRCLSGTSEKNMSIKMLLVTLLLLLFAGVGYAQTCNGLVADIVWTEVDDDIVGTAGDDVIAGLGVNDRI